MSIRTWWKERSEEIERVRKVRFVTNLHQKLEAISQEGNEGRLRHLVYSLPEVARMETESGGWANSSVRITMTDHFTIIAYELWLPDALKDAAKQVYYRLLEKRGIPTIEVP